MLWPPPVDLGANAAWWQLFWEDESHVGFGAPSDGLLNWIPEVAPGDRKTAADIASGNGRYAIELALRGYETTAIELTQSGASRILRNALNLGCTINIETSDFLAHSALSRSYDVIVCSGLLEEIPREAYPTVIAGFLNWSAPGGIVINRYCLEIEGRGVFVEDAYVSSLYDLRVWDIIFQEELTCLKMSKGGFNVRHGTVIARRKPDDCESR
jgi:hypothetical protein